jgi:hypothetical protein
MANTVSIISLANTFGDWVSTTVSLARENNDLAANNYYKTTGTIFLNDPTLGLQVGKDAIVGGAFQVQGTGSSAYVQNDLRVDKQIISTNTSNGIYAVGPITTLSRIFANGSGLGLYVANNVTFGGTANASNLFVTSGTTTGNIQIQGLTTTNSLTVNASSYIGNSLVAGGTISTGGAAYHSAIYSNSSANIVTSAVVGTTLSVGSGAWVNALQSNTTAYIGTSAVVGTTLSTGGAAWVNGFTSNTAANIGTSAVVGTTLSVGGPTWVNALTSNTAANIGSALLVGTTITAVGKTYTDGLQANNGITTSSISGTGSLYFDKIQGNTSVNTATLAVTGSGFLDKIQGNTSVNTATLAVTGSGYLDKVQANTSVNTATLAVTSSSYLNVVQANTSVNTRTISATGTGYFDTIVANTSINSPLASGSLNSLAVGLGGLTVTGSFTISGSTVYNTNLFTLSAGTPLSKDNVGVGGLAVYRVVANTANAFTLTNQIAAGVANTANAQLRFNYANNYWEAANTSANTGGYATSNGYFYRLITQELIDDTGNQNYTGANVASAYLANTIKISVATANTFLQANDYTTWTNAQANTGAALAAAKVYTDSAALGANSVITTANTNLKLYGEANTGAALAAAKVYTDSAALGANSVITTANTNLRLYGEANTGAALAAAKVYGEANTGAALAAAKTYTDTANTNLKAYVDTANTSQDTKIVAVNTYATSGFGRANTSSQSFTGTNATTAAPTSPAGVITFASGNGITVTGSGSTLTISSPQDLQTTASPTFVGLSGTPTAPTPATGLADTRIATAAFVEAKLNNGNTYTHTATNSNNSGITNDTTNATMYPVWVTSTSGSLPLKVSSTNLYFNPSTGSLSATIFNALSDENRKENIVPIINSTSIVKQINGVSFNWKDNGKKSYGHIAQQLEQILPELVDTNAEGVKSVNYNGIIAFLVEAVKEMDKRITELESK